MSRRGKDLPNTADHAAQDGARSTRSAKEAAIRLLTKPGTKDPPPRSDQLHADRSEREDMETSGLIWSEDTADAAMWDAVSTQAPLPTTTEEPGPSGPTAEPTLRDVLSAVTSCKVAITALTTEIKGVKL